MILYKTDAEVDLMKQSAVLVSKTLTEVAKTLKPGITTFQLDRLCFEFIRDHKAIPSFLNYRGYPFTICASVNDVVVHGFPNNSAIKEGDVVSIDMGVILNGWHGDHAYTFLMGEANDDVLQLMRVTKESLYKGIEKAVAGNRVGDIAFAIQEHTERKHHYGVVRELVGHGIGRTMHEAPEMPNYGKRGRGKLLMEGMVVAIEPMINQGTKNIKQHKDGWTITTADGKPSAHFEHDVAIIDGKPELLSTFAYIYKALGITSNEENEFRKQPFVL